MTQMSPLRRRMINDRDMTIRNLSPATQRSYISAVAKFSRYIGRSPDQLGLDDAHAFQVHLVSTGISWPALNQIVCALLHSERLWFQSAYVLGRDRFLAEPAASRCAGS
jgi:hypothetical protein